MNGATLTELMVAMTVGILLLFGVATLFAQSRQSFDADAQAADAQSNLRFALEAIVSDAAMAGYTGRKPIVTEAPVPIANDCGPGWTHELAPPLAAVAIADLDCIDAAHAVPDSGALVVKRVGAYALDPDEYLARRQSYRPGTVVVNLCRSYRYRSKGYYVSLVADARSHRVLPAIETLEELSESFGVYRVLHEAGVPTLSVPEMKAWRPGQKRAEETAVLEWLAQGEAGQPALDAYAELVEIESEASATRERDLILSQLHQLGTVGLAMRLYRNAIERTRPDPDREPGYQQRDQPQIAGAVAQMDRRYHPDMDRILQRYWLQQYVALPPDQRVAVIDEWLGGDDEEAIEAALERLASTGLANAAERMAWLAADRDAFEGSSDPVIRYAVAMTPVVIEQEMANKARAGRILQARPAYLRAVAEFRRSRGEHVYPDANSSLRITFGNVTGYRGLDGTRHRAFTRLQEVADKATGEEPFNAPQPLLDAIADKRHGGLADRRLRSVPVNFLSDLDVTGGNSGSPVLDADGRLVGLLFDMNWESVSSNWVFDADMTRTISVDQRYMRWVMQEAFPAPELLEELDLPRMRR